MHPFSIYQSSQCQNLKTIALTILEFVIDQMAQRLINLHRIYNFRGIQKNTFQPISTYCPVKASPLGSGNGCCKSKEDQASAKFLLPFFAAFTATRKRF